MKILQEANEEQQINIEFARNELSEKYKSERTNLPLSFVNLPLMLSVLNNDYGEDLGDWNEIPFISNEEVGMVLEDANLTEYLLDYTRMVRFNSIKFVLSILNSLKCISLGISEDGIEYIIDEEKCSEMGEVEPFLKSLPFINTEDEDSSITLVEFAKKVIDANKTFAQEDNNKHE